MTYFLASLSILAVVWLSYKAVKLRRRWLRKYHQAMSEFYEQADILLQEPDLPPELIGFVEFIHSKASDPLGAAFLVWQLLSRNGQTIADVKSHPHFQKVDAYLERHPKSERALGQMCVSSMLAMSYRAYFLGGTVRKLIFFDAGQHERRTCDVTVGIYELEHAKAA